LECEGHTACFKFIIDGGECNNKFKRWWPDVWFVIVCEHLLMLQCHSYNHYQSQEFLGEFQTLCEQAMIDHHTTSRDHPEVDGLAERMVQTVKRGLWKYSLKKGHHGDWDLQLPWLAIGYRFSKQASLASFFPYYLLFGRHPILPKAIQADADTVLANMDNPDTWALVSEQRADLFKHVMPMALENLSIAQHRDTLRYATIRGGGYRPQVRQFQPGDYVYLEQTAPTTLDVTVG
jgi:hypothetical protein